MSSATVDRAVSIVTASWRTALPAETVRVGISRGLPRRQSGFRMLPSLAPGPWFKSVDEAEYVARYHAQLALLDAGEIHRQLVAMAASADRVALLCFEQVGSGQWCHRSMAAVWLAESLGIAVPELGYERLDQHEHPMLPASLRSRIATSG